MKSRAGFLAGKTAVFLLVIALFPHLCEAQKAGGNKNVIGPSASIQKNTPSWLTIGAAYRFRTEGRTGIGYREGAQDAYGLSRLLINIGVQPKPWVKFFFQGQDARAPGKNNANQVFRDPFDIRQAYVQFGDPENGWVTVRGGRQELKYGAQRLVGPLDWTNTARQFDAVKLTLGKKDMSVDIFAASVVRIDQHAPNRRRDGNNLHGIYGQLNRLIPKTIIEPYTFWKTTPRVLGENDSLGDADLFTSGLRVVRPLPGGFDSSMEMARQFGTFAGDNVSAWAGYWILGYTLPAVPLTPRLSVEYAYATGDGNSGDGIRGTFDQLFPTGHLYHGLADQVGWRNIKDVRAGIELRPSPKLKLGFNVFSFWLADKNDHLYNVAGVPVVRSPAGGAASAFIGREVDVTLAYKPSSNVTVGGGVGHLFPGAFLKQNSPGSGTSFPFLFCNYIL